VLKGFVPFEKKVRVTSIIFSKLFLG